MYFCCRIFRAIAFQIQYMSWMILFLIRFVFDLFWTNTPRSIQNRFIVKSFNTDNIHAASPTDIWSNPKLKLTYWWLIGCWTIEKDNLCTYFVIDTYFVNIWINRPFVIFHWSAVRCKYILHICIFSLIQFYYFQ